MHLSILIPLALVYWAPRAAAHPAALAEEAAAATKSHTLCYTSYADAAAPAKLATSTTTTQPACTTTSTSTITILTAPTSKTTVTSTKTITSTAEGKGTATSTVTKYTSTSVSVTTTTSTFSTTSYANAVATYTVPTSSGFIPVQSSLPGTSYDGKAGSIPANAKRDVSARDTSLNPLAKGKAQAVNCVVVEGIEEAKCSKVVSRSTTTVTTTATTLTATAHTVTTSTFVPSVTTTKTVTTRTITTSTSTATTSTTTTFTSTSYTSTTTAYAACASNNIVDVINGAQIGGMYYYATKYAEAGSDALSADSAYDCCVAGVLDPHPGATWQYYATQQACYVTFVTADAPESQTDQSWEVNVVNNNGYILSIGNLNYGLIDRNVANPAASASASARRL